MLVWCWDKIISFTSTLGLMCGTQEPNRIPDSSNADLLPPLVPLQMVFSYFQWPLAPSLWLKCMDLGRKSGKVHIDSKYKTLCGLLNTGEVLRACDFPASSWWIMMPCNSEISSQLRSKHPPSAPRMWARKRASPFPQSNLESPLGVAASCVAGPFGQNWASIMNRASVFWFHLSRFWLPLKCQLCHPGREWWRAWRR